MLNYQRVSGIHFILPLPGTEEVVAPLSAARLSGEAMKPPLGDSYNCHSPSPKPLQYLQWTRPLRIWLGILGFGTFWHHEIPCFYMFLCDLPQASYHSRSRKSTEADIGVKGPLTLQVPPVPSMPRAIYASVYFLVNEIICQSKGIFSGRIKSWNVATPWI